MQIEKLSDLVFQQIHIKDLLATHSETRRMLEMRRSAIEVMLGKDTFSFNLIRAQMGLYEGAIQQMDKVEELHRKHLSDIENMIDSIRKVLMSRAWYIQALCITDETRKEWTTLSLQEQIGRAHV